MTGQHERDVNALVRVPWGMWEPGGAWRHNPALSMSAAEQRAANEAAGYHCRGTDGVTAAPKTVDGKE